MHKTGARRFLQVSGSVVADEGESPYLRYLLKPLARRTFLRHVCADMRHGEEEIRDSDLDWTIFRPPSLTDKAATGAYRTAIDRNLPHGFTVSRADLAACMLASLQRPGHRAPARSHRQLASGLSAVQQLAAAIGSAGVSAETSHAIAPGVSAETSIFIPATSSTGARHAPASRQEQRLSQRVAGLDAAVRLDRLDQRERLADDRLDPSGRYLG